MAPVVVARDSDSHFLGPWFDSCPGDRQRFFMVFISLRKAGIVF
jgi:hypothetical protein